MGAVLKRMAELAGSVVVLHEWISLVLLQGVGSKYITGMERMAGETTEGERRERRSVLKSKIDLKHPTVSGKSLIFGLAVIVGDALWDAFELASSAFPLSTIALGMMGDAVESPTATRLLEVECLTGGPFPLLS